MRRILGVALAAAGVTFASPSPACAVCASGDATLAPAGSERPFRNRVQAVADFRAGSVEAAGNTLNDCRLELAASYAPSESVLFSFGAPGLTRQISSAAGTGERTSFGDVELRVHVVRARLLAGGLRERIGVLVALKLPTAPEETAPSGAPLSSVLQPGCGSLVPAAGVDYALGKGDWSAYANASLWLPFAVRAGPHAGDSVRAGVRAQWQPVRALAVRVGPSVRLDTSGELAGGAPDPSSGGVVGYVAAELVASPATDFVMAVGALYPALQALRGDHREGAIATATIAYDF